RMVSARNTRIPRLVRDYALAIAFWLSVSVLVAWQMYGFERLLSKPVVLHDLLLVYGARYLTVAILTPPIFYLVERWPVTGVVLRQSLAQSELQALRAQLHPHFLFNTLQGISTLIETDRVTAQGMLRALAALLRTVLKHGSADLVPFREESSSPI